MPRTCNAFVSDEPCTEDIQYGYKCDKHLYQYRVLYNFYKDQESIAVKAYEDAVRFENEKRSAAELMPAYKGLTSTIIARELHAKWFFKDNFCQDHDDHLTTLYRQRNDLVAKMRRCRFHVDRLDEKEFWDCLKATVSALETGPFSYDTDEWDIWGRLIKEGEEKIWKAIEPLQVIKLTPRSDDDCSDGPPQPYRRDPPPGDPEWFSDPPNYSWAQTFVGDAALNNAFPDSFWH